MCDLRTRNAEYQYRLQALEDKIGNLPIMTVSFTFGADDAIATQVYQTAARIYFARAAQSSWKLSTTMSWVLDNIFAGPLPGHACGYFFNLFILACEARTDEQRTAIQEMLEMTKRNAKIRGVDALRNTMQSIWVQQDLQADDDLLVNYLGLMSAVSNSGEILKKI